MVITESFFSGTRKFEGREKVKKFIIKNEIFKKVKRRGIDEQKNFKRRTNI